MAKRDASYEEAKAEFPADFAPKPTVFSGGLDRMVRLWNKARDKNTGGYGGNRLFQISGWSGTGTMTSCSPFTATIVGMMFDPDGDDDRKVWEPKYDGGTRPLTDVFYTMHNGDFTKHAIGAARARWFAENKWCPTAITYLGKPLKHKTGAEWVNDSAHSLVWYNLGYEIDPRDMRRGDMVGIDWVSGGGHATFCWDVHLDAAGEVDCWLYLSANSPQKVGVTVSTFPRTLVVAQQDGKWKATEPPIFEDKVKYVTHGEWMCLPHVAHTDVQGETFKAWPNQICGKANWGQFAIENLRVTRFWGFPPPDNPHGTLLGDNADLARRLAKYQQPEPFSKGSCEKPGGGKKVSSKPVKKSHPEPKKAVAPAQAQQKKEEAVPHQLWVESALTELFRAKWIDKDPGNPDSVADAQSKAAIEDFQAKFKVDGEAGHAGPKTRAALDKALSDLHDGKPNPNARQPRTPVVEQFYWSPNTVQPGGSTVLGVKGDNLDLVSAYDVTLTDRQSGASETVSLPITVKNGAGSAPLRVPARFGAGATLGLRLSAAGVSHSSDVLLYVARPAEQRPDWPWDDTKWPAHVQDMLAQLRQLRAAPRGRGTAQRRWITQYGVWDQVADGDTPVLDRKGRELGRVDRRCLFLADLEGTMRLDGRIVNLVTSGNVFDAMGNASFERFDPAKSRWIDVSAQAPWGMGAKMPLIPFRTLAHDPRKEPSLYGRKVFIAELAGQTLPTGETHNGVCIVGDAGSLEGGLQFDLFVGPERGRISLPAQCNVEIL